MNSPEQDRMDAAWTWGRTDLPENFDYKMALGHLMGALTVLVHNPEVKAAVLADAAEGAIRIGKGSGDKVALTDTQRVDLLCHTAVEDRVFLMTRTSPSEEGSENNLRGVLDHYLIPRLQKRRL